MAKVVDAVATNSEEEKEDELTIQYHRDGFVGPIDVLTPTESVELLHEFHQWRKTLPNEKVVGDMAFKPHLFLPLANTIVRHPNLIRAVQRVLQHTTSTTTDSSIIYCWSSEFIIKEANTLHFFSPHQDGTYTGLEPSEQAVTAWVALTDPVSEQDGCLMFWKHSHQQGQRSHTDHPDPNNLLSRGMHCETTDTTAVVDDCNATDTVETQDNNTPSSDNSGSSRSNSSGGDGTHRGPVAVALRGGQATLHHFHTVHQSGPNLSNKTRIGLGIRYLSSNVRQTDQTIQESVTRISSISLSSEDKADQEHNKHRHEVDDDNDDDVVVYKDFDIEPDLPNNPTMKELEQGMMAHTEAIQREMDATAIRQATANSYYDSDSSNSSSASETNDLSNGCDDDDDDDEGYDGYDK